MNIGKVESLKIFTLSEDYAGYDSLFWASFGISLLLCIKSGEGEKNILFDTASDAEPVLHNMNLLGINRKEIDIIFLSHSHFDHTGGLAEILKEIDKADVPVIAHPEIFNISIIPEPYLEPYRSSIYLNQGLSVKNMRKNVEDLGGRWYLARDPLRLMPGVMTTGEISADDKVDFEKRPNINLLDLKDGKLVPSQVRDDISLCVNTEKGLVIITGCAHAGIVSIVKKSISISGNDNVYAILGGFHLLHARDQQIDKTITGLRDLSVKEIYSGHCTGTEAEYRMKNIFKDRFKRLHSGKIIEF